MATVNSRAIVDQLIVNDGQYSDDPELVKIVQYTNRWGGTCWGLVYPQDDPDRYEESEYVRNPKVIWERS